MSSKTLIRHSVHAVHPASSTSPLAPESCGAEPALILAAEFDALAASSPAGDALYAQLAPLVRRLIRQYGKTPEMRQDLAGELYCRFCFLIERYDPARGVPLRPYLIRQLNAAAYVYARQQWRLEKRLLPLETEAQPNAELATEDPTLSWIHSLSQEQVFAKLPQALEALPTRQRQAVILRYYEEYSFEEIAAALEVQTATARSLLRHGLNKLRTSLAYLANECG